MDIVNYVCIAKTNCKLQWKYPRAPTTLRWGVRAFQKFKKEGLEICWKKWMFFISNIAIFCISCFAQKYCHNFRESQRLPRHCYKWSFTDIFFSPNTRRRQFSLHVWIIAVLLIKCQYRPMISFYCKKDPKSILCHIFYIYTSLPIFINI